jgi:hypothetical protein
MSETESIIEKAVTQLGEHFDTVQIFVTRHESGEKGGTLHNQSGVGNWYARYGQVREWVNQQEEVGRRDIEESKE